MCSESIQPHRRADSGIVSDPFAGVFHANKRCGKPKLKRSWGPCFEVANHMRLIGTMGSHSADRSDTRLKQFDVEGPHPMYAYVLHRGVGII